MILLLQQFQCHLVRLESKATPKSHALYPNQILSPLLMLVFHKYGTMA